MTMERDSLVARLRAEEARMQRLWDACAEFHAKHKGTPAAFDFNSLKHAMGGRDPVLEEAAAALSRPEQVVKALEALINDVQEWVDAVGRGTSWDYWDHHYKHLAYGGLDKYRSCLTTAAPLQADASAPASPAIGVQAVKEGLQRAKTFVADRRDNYIAEHGIYDPDTGATEFPGNGDETVCEWEEIIEGIEALEAALHPAPEAASAGAVEPFEARPWVVRVGEVLDEGDGFWRSCSGCHELNEGAPTGDYSSAFRTHVGCGCSECGGLGVIWDATDYAEMADFIARDMGQNVPVSPSDTAPSPKGVSDGVRAAAKAVLDARDKWNERQEKPEFLAFSRALDHLATALSQEPVPSTAEERAASKEGA